MYQKKKSEKWILLSHRQRMSPFPNCMSMEAVCNQMKKHVGCNLKEVLVIFQGNILYVFNDVKSRKKVGPFILRQIYKNPKFYSILNKKQNYYGKQLVAFAKKSAKFVSTSFNNHKLYNLFVKYENIYKQVYATYGSVWSMEGFLMDDLFKIVEKRLPNQPKFISDVLNILTKTPSAMVVTRERKDFLQAGLKILGNLQWVGLVKAQNLNAIKKDKKLTAIIFAHVKKFFWISRDYEDPILTFEMVVKNLSDVFNNDVKKEYEILMTKIKADDVKRKEYIKRLRLTKEELQLFSAMRDAAHLKELRKRYVSESLYYFDVVLAEIAKRLYLTLKQVRFMSIKDVYNALVKQKDLSSELNERMQLSVWYAKNKQETKIMTGREAQKIFETLVKVNKNQKEFHGMPVSPGVAKGPVKIVMNPQECDKVEKGDIIVSVQVVPSFSNAILKAAGIICDGGHGITSHAATLAREAGIPCVIQTQFAREVLKDGDLVEVDGYKGVARIIET